MFPADASSEASPILVLPDSWLCPWAQQPRPSDPGEQDKPQEAPWKHKADAHEVCHLQLLQLDSSPGFHVAACSRRRIWRPFILPLPSVITLLRPERDDYGAGASFM